MTDSRKKIEPIDGQRFQCPKWNGFGSAESFWWMDEGWRKCSYCGSLHPDDMIEAVRDSIKTGGKTNIDAGKAGKHYVRGKTEDGKTRNGKFYGAHMPEEKRKNPRLNNELGRALKISWDATFPPEPGAVDQLGNLVKEDGDAEETQTG